MRRDTLLSLAAIILVGLSSLLFDIGVGRIYGDQVLGELALALAIGLGGAQLVGAGLGPALTRYIASDGAQDRISSAYERMLRAYLIGLGLALALAIALFSTSGWLEVNFGLAPALLWPTILLLLLQSAYVLQKAVLYGLGQLEAYSKTELLAALAFGLWLIWMLWNSPASISPFIVANLVFCLAASAIIARFFSKAKAGDPSTEAPAPLQQGARSQELSFGRYAWIAWWGSAAALLRLQILIPLTAYFWPASEVGQLRAAMIVILPMMLIPRAVELALLPRLASAWATEEDSGFRRMSSEALAVTGIGIAFIAGPLILAAGPFLSLLFGPGFSSAISSLRWIVVAAWALGMAAPAVSSLSGADGVRIPNAAGIAGLLSSLIGWSYWIPRYGAEGAAIGLAAGSIVNAAIPLWAAARRYEITIFRTFRTQFLSILLLLLGLYCLGSERWSAEGIWTLSPQSLTLPIVLILLYWLALIATERERLLNVLRISSDAAST